MRRVLGMLLLAAAGLALASPEQDYQDGRRAYFAGDMAGASALLQKAADHGHAPAQALYGILLKRTDDVAGALEYLRRAAEQGNHEAQFELGSMYAGGEGVARDPLAARRWIEGAARAGHRASIVAMAEAYLRGGLGLDAPERDGPAALEWLRLAADHGHAPALERLAAAYRRGEFGLAVNEREAAALETKARGRKGAR